MKDNYTHVLFIIDDSASMTNLLSDSIGGFNKFVEEQTKLDGECRMDTILFGAPDDFRYYTKDEDINDIKELTEEDHSASGWSTSLLDALGRGINDLGKFLKEKPESERPERILVNVFTDGMENSSREFTPEQVKEMIEEQTDKYNWEFTFLASDLQASNMARSMGITNVAMASKTSGGMRAAYSSMTNNASSYRTLGKTLNVQEEYNKEEAKEDSED